MSKKSILLAALAVMAGVIFAPFFSEYAVPYIGKQRTVEGQTKLAEAEEEWAYTLAIQAYIYAFPSHTQVKVNR